MLKKLFAGIMFALAAAPAAAQLFGEAELLEPEKAFRISARALDEPPLDEVRQILDRASPKR
jgi:hypothetical protein